MATPGFTSWWIPAKKEPLPEKFLEFEMVIKERRRQLEEQIRQQQQITVAERNLHHSDSNNNDFECDFNLLQSYIPDVLGFISYLGECIKDIQDSIITTILNALERRRCKKSIKIVVAEPLSSSEDEGFEENVRARRRRSSLLRRRVRLAPEDTGALGDHEDNDDNESCVSSGFISDAESTRTCSSVTSSVLETLDEVPKNLYSHDELPTWMRNNEFILSGHRPPLFSYRACAKSMFQMHSETGNIWTHLFGCVFFGLMGLYTLWLNPVLDLDFYGWLTFCGFFCGAVLCMGFSAFYHTVNCHSPEMCNTSCKMDYSGIVVLILCSVYPWVYYHHYCNPISRAVYMIIGAIAAMLTLKVAWSPIFGEPEYRAVRSAIFIGFALCCGILPCLHYGLLHGFHYMIYESGFIYILQMVALYVTGAFCYAFRIPEKFFPGRFDLIFQSHQIMHVFVIFGTLAQFVACVKTADHILNQTTCDALPKSYLWQLIESL